MTLDVARTYNNKIIIINSLTVRVVGVEQMTLQPFLFYLLSSGPVRLVEVEALMLSSHLFMVHLLFFPFPFTRADKPTARSRHIAQSSRSQTHTH